MILAFTRGAFSAVNWFSSAAGIRMSHSSSSAAAVLASGVAPGKVRIDAPPLRCWTTSSSFKPLGLRIAPSRSAMATTSAPASRQNFAA